MASPLVNATIAVVMGSGVATSRRNAINMITRAAITAMISLARVLGLESCWPR